jgi:hypothetical protein
MDRVQKSSNSECYTPSSETLYYQLVVFLVILYGYESWTFAVREEHRPRVFEGRLLRGIFGPMRKEMKGQWRMSLIICTVQVLL